MYQTDKFIWEDYLPRTNSLDAIEHLLAICTNLEFPYEIHTISASKMDNGYKIQVIAKYIGNENPGELLCP